jgi:uncharacterized protein YkwD
MPRRIHLVAVLAALTTAAGLLASARAADGPYASLLAPSGACGPAGDELDLDAAIAQQTMLCLTNYARTQSGLGPLTLNDTLSAAGRAKLSGDLSCNEFSHTPCGRPFDAVFADYVRGATGYQIGENIAWGTGSYGSPRQTMAAWLASDGHRENILTAAFRELGVGYLPDHAFQGYSGATLWSQQFGVRSEASAPAAPEQPAAEPAPKKKPLRGRSGRSTRPVSGARHLARDDIDLPATGEHDWIRHLTK